jgi:hypothetical protein
VGTISPVSVLVPLDAYLVPPKTAGDLAGIDLLPHSATSGPVAHGEVSVRQLTTGTSAGAIVLDLALDLSTLPLPTGTKLGSAALNINGTVNGRPFTRMPTNCTVATPSTVSVAYGAGTTPVVSSASPDISPTGCGSLSYSPGFTATAVRDTSDPGVAITTDITQAATDAATKSVALSVPLGTFSPNAAVLGIACSATAHPDPSTCPSSSQVGTVTATSPLLPIGMSGNVYVTVSGGSPGLAIVLLTPFKVVLSGAIVLGNPVTTTFGSIPDIPLSDLKVSLTGGPNAAFTTSCSPKSSAITGSFTGQNGKAASVPAPVTVQNCPSTGVTAGPPTISSTSLTGLASGKPRLKFTVKSGINNAPKLKTISLGGLNGGLGLSGKAIVTKKTCTGKGKKKKCKTTLTVKGLSLSGATLASAKLSGGKLVLGLKAAVSSATVTVASPLLTETKALLKKAKKNKAKGLKATVGVTDATGKPTSFSLKLS